jgi:carbamoyl-phosphate synthase large subunit
MTEKTKIVVAVTGLNAVDNPGPGVAVIRSLKESGVFDCRIIGLSYESLEPGLYMHDIVDKTYQIPYPQAGTEALLNRLEYIHEKEKLNVIIPNFDAELYNFIKIKDKLNDLKIATYLPDIKQFEARDKLRLYDFGVQNGFNVPHDILIRDQREIKVIAQKFDFPVMVKGKFYDAAVVHSMDQIEKEFMRIRAKWGLPVIIQEFIKGTEINIALLADGHGKAISIVPMRKLYITDKGKAWAGITIEDEKLTLLGRKFAEQTMWRGACELEIMLDDTGKPYILEINPRFPAWIYLTAAAGQNQPEALVKMALGMSVDPMEKYEAGKIFIRYAWELITDIHEFQKISGNGEL